MSSARRKRREVEDADGSSALSLRVPPDQEDKLVHQKLASAFGGLRTEFQEVLSSVILEGLSYEETAVRTGCAVGTVKSRVNRARKQLAQNMHLTEDDVVGWTRVGARQAGTRNRSRMACWPCVTE